MSLCVVTKSIEFDAGHRVPFHTSKCRNPHGHRYRVTAEVLGPIRPADGDPESGMVVDFGCIKELLMRHVHDRFDHAFLVWEQDQAMRYALTVGSNREDPNPFNPDPWRVVILECIPTAEELALWMFNEMAKPFAQRGVTLTAIEVAETPTSIARYCPEAS